MNFTYFLFSFLFLQTSSFSINRRSALASMIGMTALNTEESNNDNPQKQLKIAPQNNFPMNILLGEESTGELGIIQEDNNEIYFYGPVSQRSCFELKNKLNSLDAKNLVFFICSIKLIHRQFIYTFKAKGAAFITRFTL